jgi:hypothetical protein
MYFQAREHGIHPLITSPILLLTIFLSPVGLIAFLAVRTIRIRTRPQAANEVMRVITRRRRRVPG